MRADMATSDKLTERQSRLHYEICAYVRTHQKRPTMAEIGERMNLSSNTVCYGIKRLKSLGYIKGIPHSQEWEIVKWYDELNGRETEIVGILYDDVPILYRNTSIGKTWLPLRESNLPVAENLFALRLAHRRDTDYQFKASVGDLLVFQRHRKLYPGSWVLAYLNGRIGLFQYSPSQTQTILKQGKDEQNRIPLRSTDEFNVIGALLMPFDKSRMRLL